MTSTPSRGFTIIESLVVIAIVGLLLVLGLPMMGEWLANSRIRTATESMLAGLQLARAEAVRRNAQVEFVLDAPPAAGWTVLTAVAGEVLDSKAANEGTSDVTLTVLPNGATRVTFDGLGRRVAVNSDDTAPIDSVALDLPESVLPAAQSRDLRLQVGLSGQIVMCDPNVSGADVRSCPP